jgi:HEAT repeat protein
MDNWLALLKNLPQDREQLIPYLNGEGSFIDFFYQVYPGIAEPIRRELERNLATRKGLKFIDLLIAQRDPNLRRWGLELIDLLPAEMRIPRLLKVFDDKDEGIKLASAAYLGRMKSVEVVKALIQGLEEERWLPARIAQALSSMGDFGVPQLIELSKGDTEKLREYAVEILSDIGTTDAGEAVREAFDDDSSVVRKTAIKASEKFPSQFFEAALIDALLREQDIPTKIQIVRTITKLRLSKAKPALKLELTANDPKLVQAARKALEAFA